MLTTTLGKMSIGNRMNDIELAFEVSSVVGRLYQNARDFADETPAHALYYLRGLAMVFCDCLNKNFTNETLRDKINFLGHEGLLKQKQKQQLKVLQHNGNKAAHPENYEFTDFNFAELANEALVAARGLIEFLYDLKNGAKPHYEITEITSSSLKDMCVKAMLERDVEAINQAGEYFKEKAKLFPESKYIRLDGYPLDADDDIEQAMFWFMQGSNSNHHNCLYQYGKYLAQHPQSTKDQLTEAYLYLRRSAAAEHPDALYLVAQMTLDGNDIFNKDEYYSFELFERAANRGQINALSQLGAMYERGIGCERNQEKAFTYIKAAALEGIPQAQYNLYVLHANNSIYIDNDIEAINWLREAAEQDYPEAIYAYACLIRDNKISDRSASDAEAEFKRALEFPQIAHKAAISAANMVYGRVHSVADLADAAAYLQHNYSLISSSDDLEIKQCKEDYLTVCKKIVGSLREHLNQNGPQPSLELSDIFSAALFDKNCTPYPNKDQRIRVLSNIFLGLKINPNNTLSEFYREACLKPKPQPQPQPNMIQTENHKLSSNMPSKLGRNDFCYCGSGLKYKKCHGG